jgi:hypothetical protein
MLTNLCRLVAGLGVALHLYTLLFAADGPVNAFGLGLFAYSCLPYLIVGLLTLAARWRWFALGAGVASLAMDATMFHGVFIAPETSTAALGLLVVPLLNLLAAGPLGGLAVWLVAWLVRRAESRAGSPERS